VIRSLGSTYGALLLCVQADEWDASNLIEEVLSLDPGFDCFIVNRSNEFSGTNRRLMEAIVSRAGEWIEVFGYAAEAIHDAIDAASVRIGRQSAIGEGDPMTAWDDTLSDPEIASYVWAGGQGHGSSKVVIVVGLAAFAANVTRALVDR
jgi:hypothetical protein